MRKPLLFLCAVVGMLAGCAWQNNPSPDSPYFTVPTGSVLELTRPLTIPADRVSIHIQNGEVSSYSAVNRYYPFCKLEMRDRDDDARVLEPDKFVVTRVSQSVWMVRAPASVQVAAAGRLAGLLDSDDGPMAAEMSTELFLGSSRQPDVYRLTCTHWDKPSFPRHLTINQIRDTLADLFRVQLAGEPEPR